MFHLLLFFLDFLQLIIPFSLSHVLLINSCLDLFPFGCSCRLLILLPHFHDLCYKFFKGWPVFPKLSIFQCLKLRAAQPHKLMRCLATALTDPADLAQLNLCIPPQRWLHSRAGCNRSRVKLQYLESSLGQKGHMSVSDINASVPGGLTVPQ